MSRLDGFVMEQNCRTTSRDTCLFMTVTAGDNGDVIMFSSEIVRVLNHAPYVHLFYNFQARCMAIKPCKKDDDAIRFHRESSYSKTRIRWSRKSTTEVLRGFLEENNSTSSAPGSTDEHRTVNAEGAQDSRRVAIRPDESYTVDGTYYSDENVVIFDLKNARALKRRGKRPET